MTEQREQSGLGPEKIRARDTSIEIYKAIKAHELMLNQATPRSSMQLSLLS